MLPIRKKERKYKYERNKKYVYHIHIEKFHLHELQRTEYWFNG